MSSKINPATSLKMICIDLTAPIVNGHEAVAIYLGKKFAVNPASREFYKISLSITEQTDYVIQQALLVDQNYDQDSIDIIRQLKEIFGFPMMSASWDNEARKIVEEAKMTLSATSSLLRNLDLNDIDPASVANFSIELLNLRKTIKLHFAHTDASRMFVRDMLLRGIDDLQFSIKHLKWMGVRHTVDNLINLSTILQGSEPFVDEDILKKCKEVILAGWGAMKMFKEVVETLGFVGGFLLGAASTSDDAGQMARNITSTVRSAGYGTSTIDTPS